jgi:putative SOS response-associated peptidase YedK
LARLLGPCTRPDILARPVSRRVNDARNQGPDLIEQLAVPASDT